LLDPLVRSKSLAARLAFSAAAYRLPPLAGARIDHLKAFLFGVAEGAAHLSEG
jgi:hypothetical protein